MLETFQFKHIFLSDRIAHNLIISVWKVAQAKCTFYCENCEVMHVKLLKLEITVCVRKTAMFNPLIYSCSAQALILNNTRVWHLKGQSSITQHLPFLRDCKVTYNSGMELKSTICDNWNKNKVQAQVSKCLLTKVQCSAKSKALL